MVKKIKCSICEFEISAQNIVKHQSKCVGIGPRKRNKGGDRLEWIRGKTFEEVYGPEKSSEIRKKMRDGLKEDKKFKSHKEETRNRISLSMRGNKNWKNSIDKTGKGIKGYYKGEFFMSSWELAFMIYCENKGIKIKRNWEAFEYEDHTGKKRKYIPDFIDLDSNKYYEVKGYEPEFYLKIAKFEHEIEIYDSKKMKPIIKEIIKIHGKDFYTALKDPVPRRG